MQRDREETRGEADAGPDLPQRRRGADGGGGLRRLFPADERGPGATEIGALAYVDRALAGAYHDKVEAYRVGLAALDSAARARHGARFADCGAARQDALLADLERGELPDFRVPPQGEFFDMLRAHLQEGLFADPAHGGNRDKSGWRLLGHTGCGWRTPRRRTSRRSPSPRAARSCL
jgi:hypothetical protein